MTKICNRCGKELPLTQFYQDPRTKDGYCGKCVACYKEYFKVRKIKEARIAKLSIEQLIADNKSRVKGNVTEKYCAGCRVIRPIEYFFIDTQGRGSMYCLECMKGKEAPYNENEYFEKKERERKERAERLKKEMECTPEVTPSPRVVKFDLARLNEINALVEEEEKRKGSRIRRTKAEVEEEDMEISLMVDDTNISDDF